MPPPIEQYKSHWINYLNQIRYMGAWSFDFRGLPSLDLVTCFPPEAFLYMLHSLLILAVEHSFGDELDLFLNHGGMDILFAAEKAKVCLPGLYAPYSANLAASLARIQRLQKDMREDLDMIHDGELYHAAYAEYIRLIPFAAKRIYESHPLFQARQRSAIFKEELVAAAWHPRRVESMLAAGADLEAL